MPSQAPTLADAASTYEHIIVEGLPYDRGFSHGQQVKSKIHRNIAYYKLPGKLPSWPITSSITNTIYIPALRKLYPTGLEELRGIADGAEVPLEDIVMLNGRYDLARCMFALQNGGKPLHNSSPTETSDDDANECTSGFFSKESTLNGESLACQNWDMSTHVYQQDLIIYLEVHPHPSEDKPSMFCLTEVGQLIRTGMNSSGMAVTANSLLSTIDYVPVSHTDSNGVYREVIPKPVLPITLARRLFLEYTNYAEGLVAINSMPRHVSGNLHVSTDGFGMSLEVTPERIYKVYGNIDNHYVLHTNHFLHQGFQSHDDSRDRYPGGSSWFRLQQLEKGVRNYKDGKLTTDLIRSAFSDHLSYPESLCTHPNLKQKNTPGNVLTGYTSKMNMTVAFVIYNLTQKTATVCRGPPCQGVFQTFDLKA